MRTTIDRIEAGRLLPQEDLRRLGLAPRRMVRVILETVDEDDEMSVTEMNARGGAFAHLADEPDVYSDSDLIRHNEDFVR
ncbi:hypothetical protein [Azospirillum halopraeferens]|uniref:hypothetical protein n=1 Tax=Azospirillum halopraeferens TaxID=34010 RepID=UPI00146FBAD8|nr:hypothetical protein [Azospirillum halopraeferens]